MKLSPKTFLPILIAALAVIGLGTVGAQITELGPWYRGLVQPSFKPPDIWFGPAWTLIFICAATAGVTAWNSAPDRTSRRWLIGLFALNAGLNSLWSLLFFKLQRPDWALIEVGFLWLSIAALIVGTRRYSRTAGFLLLPYLLWVTFASAINYATVQLNGPFGQLAAGLPK